MGQLFDEYIFTIYMYMYHYDEFIKKNNTILHILGEGNGSLLRCSCLVYPMDRGAWGPVVHGVMRVRHDLATKPPHILN